MDDKLSIRVNIAERYYPLKIDKKDEENIRKAAKLINDKVLQYNQKYNDKDSQDFLAMAALQFVIKLIESEDKNDLEPVNDELKNLNEQIEELIAE